MSSKRIKTLTLATAIAICSGVAFSGPAEAGNRATRHYDWHSGWHKDGYGHRGWARYGYPRLATCASGGYDGTMGAAACGCPPAYSGYADEQGEGGVGLGAPTF